MKPPIPRTLMGNTTSHGLRTVCRFLVLLLLAQAVTVPVVRAQSPQHFLFCFSDDKQRVVYYSDIFEKDGTITHSISAIVGFSAPAASAFRQYLKQKYSFDGSVDCGFVHNSLAESAAQKQRSQAAEKQAASHEFVETGWKYVPGQ